MTSSSTLKETDLYPPLKAWLERQGYAVRGEVGRCDLAAAKDGDLIAVELKIRPSLALLAQAAERQEYADAVYVALPAARNCRPPASRGFRRLLARLGIGLILVTFLKTKTRVEVLMHPRSVGASAGGPEGGSGAAGMKGGATERQDRGMAETGRPNGEIAAGTALQAADGPTGAEANDSHAPGLPPRRRPKRKAALLREISGRDLDLTPGGLPGGPGRVTAYRQRAVRLAAWLGELGEAAPKELVRLGAPADAGVILQMNLYGWFDRVRRGVYRLHPSGAAALDDVAKLARLYRRELAERQEKGPEET